jgi:hypothetical protein
MDRTARTPNEKTALIPAAAAMLMTAMAANNLASKGQGEMQCVISKRPRLRRIRQQPIRTVNCAKRSSADIALVRHELAAVRGEAAANLAAAIKEIAVETGELLAEIERRLLKRLDNRRLDNKPKA